MTLLQTLLERGDKVSIENGRLLIEPCSGKAIPDDWLDTHKDDLIRECLTHVKSSVFQYLSYSVGNYGGGKYSGVTLQFVALKGGQSAYACFNAITKRQRTNKQVKKGSPLPNGQFRVNKKSGFARFWSDSGLPIPPRYYDRMGQLSKVIFTAEKGQGDRLYNGTIKPLNISYEEIKLATKERLSSDQGTTNSRPRVTTKETAETQSQQGLEGDSNYGSDLVRLKVIRKDGYKGNVIPLSNIVNDQSNDEWLNEYSDAKPIGKNDLNNC